MGARGQYPRRTVRFLRPRLFVSVVSRALVLGLGLSACTPPPSPIASPCPPPVPIAKPATPLPKVETNEPRMLEVRLAPVRETAEVTAIDVTLRFSVPPVDFGETAPFSLRIGESAAYGVEELAGRDSEGSLAIRRDDADPTHLVWRAERRARGPVTLNYRANMQAKGRETADLAVGPAGFIALGRAFLLLPETTEPHAIRVFWDLTALGDESRGISSLGDGENEWVRPPSALATTIWAAGQLRNIVIEQPGVKDRSVLTFRATSLGEPSFDFLEVAPFAARFWKEARVWGGNASAEQVHLFFGSNGLREQHFRMKLWGRDAVAVMASGQGFAWAEKRALARTLVRLSVGASAEGRVWFDEGVITYSAMEILQKSGLSSNAEILSEIVARSERYFGSGLQAKAGSELDDRSTPAIVEQAEDRGFLFAAEVSASVLRTSNGKRSLQDVLRDLGPKQATDEEPERAPHRITTAALREALIKEIGETPYSKLEDALLKGSLLEPATDAFGPCFEKVKKKIPVIVAGAADTKNVKTVDGFSWGWSKAAPAMCGAPRRR